METKCRQCEVCLGEGCSGELPGMGGVQDSSIFRMNCRAWDGFGVGDGELPRVRFAPMTGAVQNMGWEIERDFYRAAVEGCLASGVSVAIGDGYPDEKLKYGISALLENGASGAVFIKPYPNEKILERMEWADGVAEIFGIDIDSYAIATMRNLVSLEEKTASDLALIKRRSPVPFAIKGVFLHRDFELVKEVRPDIVVISNHGGRVDTVRRSTAAYLAEMRGRLRDHCGEVWVDGGLRKRRDLAVAKALGATEVMVGRPFASALLRHGPEGIARCMRDAFGIEACCLETAAR